MTSPQAAPFLRWAGGKRRLLPVLLAGMPAKHGRYWEPFLGGGAVFFAARPSLGSATIADFNPDLAATYQQLRDNVDAVVTGLTAISAGFDESAFYKLRAAKPQTDLERAIRFIAFNRTCFNGLFRVNSKGEWNTPYGKLANPTICNEPLLRAVSASLQTVDVIQGSYEYTAQGSSHGDFLYCDPPYIPLSTTASFSKYAASDFNDNDQRALAKFLKAKADAGVWVMLSNSDTPASREIFGALPMYQVSVHRSIAAASGSRGQVHEIIATNIPLSNMRDSSVFQSLATRI